MMMEEIGDDTNGESTFEFVGGKMDENPSRGETVSSTTQMPGIDPATSIASPATGDTLSSSHLFSSVSASESFLPSSPSQMASNMSPMAGNSAQASVPAIPMYNPSQHGGSPISLPFAPPPVASTQVFYQPIPSVSPPPQNPYSAMSPGYGQSSPLPPPPPPPTAASPQNYAQPMAAVPQAALELPVDDNFVSSSGQPFQESGPEKGVWGWIKGSEFLNKVAEKAKNSVDSVITTLDPGMKEIIYSGGDVNLIVASSNEPKISAIREAFQSVFGKATVEGIAVQSTSIAPQPVGYSAGSKAAEERINNLRQQGLVHEHQVVVAIENFLAELTPDKWFDLGCILLQDPVSRINLQVYTEAIPVDNHFITQAKERTPPDFPLGWSGFAVTIGQIIGPALGVHHSEWHQALTSVSRREILLLAAKTVAGLYKTQLKR